MAIGPRQAALLSKLAAGFFERTRNMILTEQERIKGALLAERERVEEALRESESNLAEVQRVAHLGCWELDLSRDELRCSDEVFRIFGLDRRESGAKFEVLRERVHPDDLELVDGLDELATTEGKPADFEHRIIRPDGEVRFVHQRVETVLDSLGKLTKLVGIVQDITERKALEERLRHQAFHDPLTDLPNRALFLDRLEQALACDSRREGKVQVLFLDLNSFKLINDSFGRVAGDQLLIKVAGLLKACVRPQDTVARFGGDEFAILVEEPTRGAGSATLIARRIIEKLQAPFFLGDHEVFVAARIGIASSTSESNLPEDLLRDAEAAMYRAKVEGGASFEVFEPSVSISALKQLKLGNDLRRAVEREEFLVRYQPRVELASGKVVGIEALLRWNHPERGVILPDDFIPFAEETALIVPIGQ